MSGDTLDRREITTATETLEVNQWFNPFENYESLVAFEDREHYQARYKELEISPIGRFRVFLVWEQENENTVIQQLKATKLLATLPKSLQPTAKLPTRTIISDGGKHTVEPAVREEWEHRLGKKTLAISINSDEERYDGQHLPFTVQIKLPDGSSYSSAFRQTKFAPITKPDYWRQDDNSPKEFILIPDDKGYLEQIQMRIVPIAKSQRSS